MKHMILKNTVLGRCCKIKKRLYPDNHTGFFSKEFLSKRRPGAIGVIIRDHIAEMQGCVRVRHGKTSESDAPHKFEEIRFCKLPKFLRT